MPISIRRARPDEMGLLCELDRKIFSEADAFDTPDLWEGLETFFITKDNAVVGSTALRQNTDVSRRSHEDNYVDCLNSLYIVSTGILPTWQSRGIGSIVKAWQIDYGRKHGFSRIVTNTRASNLKSIRLNQKFGFKIINTVPNWYGTETAIILELKL